MVDWLLNTPVLGQEIQCHIFITYLKKNRKLTFSFQLERFANID